MTIAIILLSDGYSRRREPAGGEPTDRNAVRRASDDTAHVISYGGALIAKGRGQAVEIKEVVSTGVYCKSQQEDCTGEHSVVVWFVLALE